MKQKVKDAVMASFIADALSLGVHWVYDAAAIKDRYGRLETMVAPELAPYHSAKEKGRFTHYGDQALVLLESVVAAKGFDLNHFSTAWQALFKDYTGYVDGATQETLKNIEADASVNPSGSVSTDLGGAARIAPLALFYHTDAEAFERSASAQTAMTHNQKIVIDIARYFAWVAYRVFDGDNPVPALEASVDNIPDAPRVQQMVTAGIESRDQDTGGAIGRFGQMCAAENALPSVIHLIAKYEDNLKDALVENIMAGGDSSARGMLAGFIIGAYQGLDRIPGSWLDDLQAGERIAELTAGIS